MPLLHKKLLQRDDLLGNRDGIYTACLYILQLRLKGICRSVLAHQKPELEGL